MNKIVTDLARVMTFNIMFSYFVNIESLFKTRFFFLAKRKFTSCYNMRFTFSIDYGRKYVIFIDLRMKGGPTLHIKGK
jgi:hypothetical protein